MNNRRSNAQSGIDGHKQPRAGKRLLALVAPPKPIDQMGDAEVELLAEEVLRRAKAKYEQDPDASS